jgi:hypothetical protein
MRVTALIGVFGGLLYAMLSYSGFFYAPAAHASVLLPGSLAFVDGTFGCSFFEGPHHTRPCHGPGAHCGG